MRQIVLAMVFSMLASVSWAGKHDQIYSYLESGLIPEARAAIERTAPQSLDDRYWGAEILFYTGEYGAAAQQMSLLSTEPKAEKRWKSLARYWDALDVLTRDMHSTESAHFVIYTDGIDGILAHDALAALEAAYDRIGAALGEHPAEKMRVEVHLTQDAFSLASTLTKEVLDRSGTVGICKFNRLIIRSPRALPLGYRWCDTLVHEYTHYLINRASHGRCPLWLHEGIARYHETLWRRDTSAYATTSSENALAQAVADNALVSFKRMYPSMVYLKDQNEITVAFAEVARAVDMLIAEYGADALPRLLRDMRTRSPKKAFKSILRVSERKFEKQVMYRLRKENYQVVAGAVSDRPQLHKIADEEYIGTDNRGHIRLGDKMRQMKRFDGAYYQYARALKNEPANPVILLKCARALHAMGNIERAAEMLYDAVEKNPNYVTPYQALGEIECMRKRYAKAIPILREAVAINPFHPQSWYYLAIAQAAERMYEDASRSIEIASQLAPQDASIAMVRRQMKRGKK